MCQILSGNLAEYRNLIISGHLDNLRTNDNKTNMDP